MFFAILILHVLSAGILLGGVLGVMVLGDVQRALVRRISVFLVSVVLVLQSLTGLMLMLLKGYAFGALWVSVGMTGSLFFAILWGVVLFYQRRNQSWQGCAITAFFVLLCVCYFMVNRFN